MQIPHGRLEPAQAESATVTCASLTVGMRCQMPVQPTSSTLACSEAVPVNVNCDGQAHWQLVHVKAAEVLAPA